MSKMTATTIRLTAIQRAQIAKLARKLGLNEANVIRLAVARLAAEEGVTDTPRG